MALWIDQLDAYYDECEEIDNKLKEGNLTPEDRAMLRERSDEIIKILQIDKEEKRFYQ